MVSILKKIPGTKIINSNTQIIVSSGVISLDEIIGGLAIGSVFLIEEDTCNVYSKVMLNYFLAEGVTNDHYLYIASHECDPQSIVKNLPSLTTNPLDDEPKVNDEKMTIAWRYQNMKVETPKYTTALGHYYDLTKPIDEFALKNVNAMYWKPKDNYNTTNSYAFKNPAYQNLIDDLKKVIEEKGLSFSQGPDKKNVLRVAIQSAGSPNWLASGNTAYDLNCKDLEIFIYLLRALARSSCVVIAVSIPSKLLNEVTIARCVHSSDTAIRLESFTGTELEKNQSLNEYQGFFLFKKFPSISCLRNMDPGPIDFGFKLRRKKFCIETLHLPPDLEESKDDEIPSMGCGSSNKHLLEF